MLIGDNEVVLFQGDSITDCGRGLRNELGCGYALMVAAQLGLKYPGKETVFLNRGVSGEASGDLLARWEKDCLALKPTIVSVYAGINDTWRRYRYNDPTSPQQFEATYRKLLTLTKEKLNAKLVLVEPFVLPYPEDRKQWREDLDPKINIIRELAQEFQAVLVPLDGLFAQASTFAPSSYWTTDGVHPTPAGHALIAKAWLEAVGEG